VINIQRVAQVFNGSWAIALYFLSGIISSTGLSEILELHGRGIWRMRSRYGTCAGRGIWRETFHLKQLPPKQTILRYLAVNEAPHGFVSPCESYKLPPKFAKRQNLAVNLERSLHREHVKKWKLSLSLRPT